VISSETSAALGAGVRMSTNVYIVGFSSAAAYFGSASGMTGLPSVTAALNMGGNSILNAAAGTFTQGITASSYTATGIGLAAAQLRLNPAANLVISSETSAALGAGVRVSTNVYIVGFSSAARYYGDGSRLTGIAAAGGVQKTGDTMTGQLTLNGSTLTINDADANTATSGLGFNNFACSGSDKLTANASGIIVCATDISGGGGLDIGGVLNIGTDAGGFSIVNAGAITANGQLTTYSSATVTGALGIGAVRLSLNPNADISSATANNYGGVLISTNVFLPFGAKYYGDGSSLSNIGASTLVQKTGDTMTGQLTMNGSTLTINDADANTVTSGLRFGNFACTGSDKLTANASGIVSCAVDVSGGGGADISGVLTVGNDAANIDIKNLGGITANGQFTTYSSVTVQGNIKNLPLAGAGNRCVFADGSGMLGVKGDDCGTGVGGGPESCVNPNNANDILVAVGDFCVDKYEATVWSAITAGTKYGVNVDDYPCNDNGQDCATAGATKIFARSVPTEVPSSSMTWFQANIACVNSGKHLITNAEWQAAAVGTPDPGGGANAPLCNTGGVNTNLTGSGTGCRSIYDIENMVGSLWEWVAEWGIYSPSQTFWNGSLNDDLAGGPSGAPIAGMIRGGAYDSVSTVAGAFAFNTSIPPYAAAAMIGFRCAMRLR
ncbi:MAG: SUMF1/EgtB/PvdO family nonheme iron enzyme, partial [Elusimicrobiota bacterium]|nr:SUMF1/EgtB/PvdO family nonheme iron enzyme [Elusimicrobiota bacterium]